MASPFRRLSRAMIVSMFVVSILVVATLVPFVSTAEPGPETKELRIAIQQDIPDFNIFNLGSNSVWKHNVLHWAFESLSDIDYSNLPYPRLAESWNFNEGMLTFTIDLRHDVVFHDGSPLTADDVVFTYHAVREGTVYSSNLVNAFDADWNGVVSLAEITVGVWKIGDYTVGMRMARPYGQFVTNTMTVPIIPQEIWQSHLNPDGTVNVLWNDPLAATGTGPFKYSSGMINDYRIMEKNYAYWGTSFVTPTGYHTYPPDVDRLYFKVFSSIDGSVLALKNGAVDHISWALAASMIPSLVGNPLIDLYYLEDNGYFYVAFNEKLRPMNMLNFRRAISHLTDKDLIVNEYMGGWGAKGSAVEPPYWGDWFNQSVPTYPYDDPSNPITTVPEDLLDAAGIIDSNGDGWRDLPDGSPMEKIVILTPPADYDPVRIKAGQAIAGNMRKVGINAEAQAIDFDTLVARLSSMDYQMLIIGWSLTTDPVSNVFDILGPKSWSNTFGFWSADDPNPYYKDLLGVNTLADAETQALAKEVDRLGTLARSTFSTSDQIKYTKWAQGVIAQAIPVDVLYYRINTLATSTHWTGWLPYMGTILNMFSLSELRESSSDRLYQGLNIGVSVPTTILSGQPAYGYALVIDDLGYAVEGAQVNLSVSGPDIEVGDLDVFIDNMTGTTDWMGRFQFMISCTGDGAMLLNATAEFNSTTDWDVVTITGRPEVPNTLALSAYVDNAVLRPGESTQVSLSVTDELGDPVQNATIWVDTYLIGAGYVDSPVVFTDANGEATMTYHAPLALTEQNAHMPIPLEFTAVKYEYEWSSSVMKTVMIYNDAEPDWVMTRVWSVSTTALDNAKNTTSITVEAVDDDGNSLANHRLSVTYSNTGKVFSPTTSIITNGAGRATVSVQMKNMAASGALKVTIGNTSVLNSVSASVTLTFVGSVPPAAEMYGGYMTYAEPAQYVYPFGSVDVTAHVWDSAGDPVDGVLAALIIGGTPYGTLTWSDDINWDTIWDGIGISIVTSGDGGNYVASGPMNTPFDEDNYWEWYYDAGGWLFWDWGMMTGVEIWGGEFTTTIYGLDVKHLDLVSRIWLVPDVVGFFNDTSFTYQIDGTTSIVSQYVIGRSYQIVTVNCEIVDPVLTAKRSDYDTTEVNGVVTDENGAPVEFAGMRVYENSLLGNRQYGVYPNSGNSRWSVPAYTDFMGEANATITAVGYPYVVTPNSIRAEVYTRALLDGAVSTFSRSQIFIHPQATMVAMSPIWEPQPVGSDVNITVHAMDAAYSPVADTGVLLMAGAGVTIEQSGTTDGSGHLDFVIETATIRGSEGGFMPVIITLGGPGYDSSGARMMVPMQNLRPFVQILEPEDGGEVMGPTVTVRVFAYDADGIWYLEIRLDSGPWIPVPGPIGDTIWNVTYNLTNVSIGTYTITAVAYDHYDVMGSDEVFIIVPIPEFTYPAVIVITMLVVVVAILRTRDRRRNR